MASTVRATPTLATPPAIVGEQSNTGSVNSQGLPSDSVNNNATASSVGSHAVKLTVSEPPSQDQGTKTRVLYEQFLSFMRNSRCYFGGFFGNPCSAFWFGLSPTWSFDSCG